MKVLFITPYPRNTAASQRFRYEQYLDVLDENDIQYQLEPFWERKAWEVLYQKGSAIGKFYYLFKGIIRRWSLLFQVKEYDYVFIHREIYPVGIVLLPWVLAKVMKCKIIYDFDDAIWLPNFADNNKRFAFLKSYRQIPALCQYAYKLSVGNAYLKAYGIQFNQNVVINPTTIDTVNYHNTIVEHKQNDSIVFGWTGTHSTMKYIESLLPVFDRLIENYAFTFLIISDHEPEFKRDYVRFKKWSKGSEIADLRAMNVGVMPLSDDKWANGKCGFKALQYMSLGVPAIVSPVGVNCQIVKHLQNGWICASEEDWYEVMQNILKGEVDLSSVGNNARKRVEDRYSVTSNANNFLGLFQ